MVMMSIPHLRFFFSYFFWPDGLACCPACFACCSLFLRELRRFLAIWIRGELPYFKMVLGKLIQELAFEITWLASRLNGFKPRRLIYG